MGSSLEDALAGVARPERRTLADGVYETLRERILRGDLKPGERLRIREVADRLGVSMMPVRDALARLSSTGLVVMSPHQGAMVAQLGLDDLRDFYGVRLILEPEAARLGLSRLAGPEVARLGKLLERMRKASDAGRAQAALKLDEEFLFVIYEAAGNARLLELIVSTWSRVQPFKLIYVSVGRLKVEHFVACDEAVLAALRDGSPEQGANAVRESIVYARDLLADLLSAERATS